MRDTETPFELTETERRALDALPREREPGVHLERHIVENLRRDGLLGREGRWPRPQLLAVAASVLLLGIGFVAGVLTFDRRDLDASSPTAVAAAADAQRYLLVLFRSPDEITDPDGAVERVAEYSAWARDLVERGHLLGGEPLASGGRLLIPTGNGVETVVQSSLGNEEPMTGYFLLSARSEAEAEALARECPHLAHGGKVMLRRIGHGGP